MKLGLAQLNTTIGDFKGNKEKILEAYRKGSDEGVELVLCPELAVCGYPPRDLLFRPEFVQENLEVLDQLARATEDTGLLVGYVDRYEGKHGRPATNAVALLHQGNILATRTKSLLPTYDVFDEDRYFQPATENLPVDFKGHRLGLTICEDIWNDEDYWPNRRYAINPAQELVEGGAEVILNVSASPWNLGKNRIRHQMLANLAAKLQRPLVYCNAVGGNDELVFDGTSVVYSATGQLIGQSAMFEEDFQVINLDKAQGIRPGAAQKSDEEKVHQALVLGLRDYLRKCGFQSAVLGLSGGIDSAVTAAIATEALGKENVRGVAMPSRYSSQGSLDDAEMLAANLGISCDIIPIEPIHAASVEQLKDVFAKTKEDTTEENIQARLRGMLLMAISNKFGSLLLTTGNKSELAVGYCTLYGDMCGGLAVISDVPKTLVYRVADWINRDQEIIPENTLSKPPSAELRPDQKDEDSLPPYEELDAILDEFIVSGASVQDLIKAGHKEDVVKQVIRLIEHNEYKRRQAAPGLKVTSKAFGMGRRIPIAQRFRS